MMMSLIRRPALLAVAALALCAPLSAAAQADYPGKPIKFIVPFPPGGTSDVMARMVSDELGKVLRQPVLVENVGGAGGVIGTERGVRAPADGYTLVMTGVGQNAVAHGLDPNIKYDTNTDFIHITQIHSGPNVLVTHPNAPFRTLAEMIDYARKNPGKLDYGFTHAASGHMAMELLRQTVCAAPNAKPPCQPLPMVGIPYRGGGPMMTAILGGEIPVMFINQDVALPHVKAGKLKAIAVSSTARNALYPDVPTVAESGYPGFEALSWSGLSVPKGTPKAVADRIEAAMAQVMASGAVVQRMSSTGFVIPTQGSKAYVEFVRTERERWIRVIKAAGIKPE
ncbi:MAG: Bug family tripartite tricarboxylate transporter substrate binding protein [Burkholderiales bacterium]|jgi:tripartite-type tricarboxylate transporter receptor subunit TctC